MESMAVGVLMVDMSGQMVLVNVAARRLLAGGAGDADPQIAGTQPDPGLASLPAPLASLLRRSLDGASTDGEVVLIQRPGAPPEDYISATAQPLWIDGGRKVGVIIVLRDVSEMKAVQRELRRVQANAEEAARATTRYLARVNHEMRTPLAAVLSYADLLAIRAVSDAERKDYAQAIRRSGERLLALLTELVECSQDHTEQLEADVVPRELEKLVRSVDATPANRSRERARPATEATASGAAGVTAAGVGIVAADSGSQTVLVVDDAPEMHEIIRAHLQSARVTLLHAHDASLGLALAREHLPDLVLLDLHMPGTGGLMLCRQLKEDPALNGIPVIVLTGATDLSTKVYAFEIGASDYVTKPFDAVELRARVRSALRIKRYQDLLASQTHIDALTGLWNRGYLDEQLAVNIAITQRQGRPVTLVLADLDDFKCLNDNYGHPFGDSVIQRVAEAFSEVSREGDVVCRYGGEEFAIILKDTSSTTAAGISERLRLAVEKIRLNDGHEHVRVTTSIGIAGSDQFVNSSTITAEILLAAADRALYRAKSRGRNRVELSVPMDRDPAARTSAG